MKWFSLEESPDVIRYLVPHSGAGHVAQCETSTKIKSIDYGKFEGDDHGIVKSSTDTLLLWLLLSTVD